MRIVVIIPALNEQSALPDTLAALSGFPVIVVDGGSQDGTPEIAHSAGVRVLSAPPGRGTQMHLGALAAADADVFWFLHADTRPLDDAAGAIRAALGQPGVIGGNFELTFAGPSAGSRLLNWLYPKLRILGLAYGDSGYFVRRDVYLRCGGFRPYPLFEDLDLLRRLRAEGRFFTVRARLVTSARRWSNRPFALALIQWIGLQILYWLGVSPRRLGRWYAAIR
jgi:rSAM/selenodomain-associated transferase 2